MHSLSMSKNQGGSSPTLRETEHILQQTIEGLIVTTLHPRTQIVITVQELNDDGCLLAACINAVCLAIVDAGIAIKSLIVASSTSIMKDSEAQLVDYVKIEEDNSRATFTFAFDASLENIVTTHTTGGSFTPTEFLGVLDTAKQHSQALLSQFRTILQNKD